jgi:uncharacterized protein YbjT (DUF2867 family)
MPTYLVAGVSGHTGAVVAQALLDQKLKVRVLVREAAKAERWKKRGAEVAVASVEDAHALGAALRGTDAAYLLLPPPPRATTGVLARARRIVDVFVQTVSGSHLKHVVFLSSLGAQHETGTGGIRGLHVAEQVLSKLQVPFTFLRAGAFVENWVPSLEAARGGELPTFLPADLKYPQVGAHDIGALAAALLTEHPKAHRTVELAGPRDVSAADVAVALGILLGSEVKAVQKQMSGMAASMQSAGFSAELAALYQEMMEGTVSGRVAFEHPEAVRRGKESLEETLRALLQRP